MAEFGENLKRIREEKGLTQQTLADHLFVTRQAVSRWEGGSRYPDLMTAKKLAEFFEVSLDELLTEEDVALYVEKNAILESPLPGGIQTVIFSMAFMCYLIVNVWNIYELGSYLKEGNVEIFMIAQGLIPMLVQLAIAAILLYGVLSSIWESINPKIAAIIAALFFGGKFVSGVIVPMLNEAYDNTPVIYVFAGLNLVVLIIVVRYFYLNKFRNPLPVYIIAIWYGVLELYRLAAYARIEDDTIRNFVIIRGIVQGFADVLFLFLLCGMTYKLYRRRKRARL